MSYFSVFATPTSTLDFWTPEERARAEEELSYDHVARARRGAAQVEVNANPARVAEG